MTLDRELTDAQLAGQLERTIRTLNKRVYNPTLRSLRAVYQGVDRGNFIVLATLDECPRLRPSELAVAVELDLSTVSRHITYFEQLGLVAREPDPLDRRASRISLTDAGRESLRAVRAARTGLLDSVFATWPADDRAHLQRLLERLLTDLHALPTPTSPATAPTQDPETSA